MVGKIAFWLVMLGFAGVVYVRSGTQGGQSGGQQTATMLSAGGGALSQLVTALEGGSSSQATVA